MHRIVPLVLSLLSAAPAAAENLPVFRRAQPLEARTGVVWVRAVFDMPLDQPVECDDGTLGCRETALFNRVWRLDFEAETQSAEEGARLERTGRGTVLLALRADAEDAEAFDEQLRRSIGLLAAAEFEEPFAGLRPGNSPFVGMAGIAAGRSWSCFLLGEQGSLTHYAREIESEGRVTSTGTRRLDGQNSLLCDQAAQVTETAWPEVIRTMPAPGALRETTVSAEVVDRLPRELFADEALQPPPGVRLVLREVPPGVSSETVHSQGETGSASLIADGREWSAVAAPLRIEPRYLERAWLSRWTIDSGERRYGPRPRDLGLEEEHIDAALIPIVPPTPPSGGSLAPTVGPAAMTLDPDIDVEALAATVAARLAEATALDLETLEAALTVRPGGLDETGWLLALCRQDGSARFWLPPTRAQARVINADGFCAELGRLLER